MAQLQPISGTQAQASVSSPKRFSKSSIPALKALRSKTHPLLKGIVAGVVLFTLNGCAQKSLSSLQERYLLSCGPEDQQGSYLNPVDARRTLKIRYDSGFSTSEVTELQRAVDAWNQESTSLRSNGALLQLEANVSATSVPSNGGDCSFPASSDGYGIALVTDENVWKTFGLSDSNPAVTVRCSRAREFVSRQVILVNAKIVRSGSVPALFQTIMKHEIGHTFGLDHSCDLSEAVHPQFVGCSKAQEIPAYREAVMYPYIRAKYFDLNENDQVRAACILGVST